MFKKLKYILDNFETIKSIVEEKKNPVVKTPTKKRRVSIQGVPDEQKKFIEDNYKI